MNKKSPVMLTILDGWGYREDATNNAIAQADTPHWDSLMAECPHSLIDASEMEVGLPTGQMGNSEVGHMNIGSGRVMLQDLPRIDTAIAEGSLAKEPAITKTIEVLKQTGGDLHLLGLLSDGGVHSHQAHISAVSAIFAEHDIKVWVHAFLDGRDTPPQSAARYLEQFDETDTIKLATMGGRFYAMDRDNRWDRVEPAYRAIVEAKGEQASDALSALKASYEGEVFDEFVQPTVLGNYNGMKDGDGLMMCNFRADRAREILHALVDDSFEGFQRKKPAFSRIVGMVEYSTALNRWVEMVYPPETPKNVLGEVLEAAGKTQLHIAETEKYAHVTFFFNGGREQEFEGETRILIQSPDVKTYDEKPEMSAPEVTDALVEAIESGAYDFIVVNYANTDMVGHTGNLAAATKAVEAVDACLGRLKTAIAAAGGAMIITADHGNAETMIDEKTGGAHTAHTLNKVPMILYAPTHEVNKVRDGRLADLAPTALALMELDKPDEMTGDSLLA